jgi:hypothetical protein
MLVMTNNASTMMTMSRITGENRMTNASNHQGGFGFCFGVAALTA